ncbi:sugar-binding protein [Candidatus Latescibacterota bacterium]
MTAYESIDTYKAQGTITSDIDTGEMTRKMETTFSIILKKPNLYLISWTQKNVPMQGFELLIQPKGSDQSGVVWSDGNQPYLYSGSTNTYSKIGSDEMALASATGLSGGAAFTIPSLFFSVFKDQPALVSRLIDPKIEEVEKVGEEDCYVISGSSSISKKETFWVSKASHLIKKYYRSLETPEGGAAIPEMTDEQLEEAIKSMGQEVTEESKKNMREMMEKTKTMLKTMKMKGSSNELHINVSSPELKKNDFKFALPEDSVLVDSPFVRFTGETNRTSHAQNGGATAYAVPLTGIQIDGNLTDWPEEMMWYPILNHGQVYGPTDIDDADLTDSPDLTAKFMVGFSPDENLLYLAVRVRDDAVAANTHVRSTDACEVYIDGDHSSGQVANSPELTAKDMPCQQYVMCPPGGSYGGSISVEDPTAKPFLSRGEITMTKTKAKYGREGNITVYEWAIEVHDQFPDVPVELAAGKTIGFDVVVVDKDGDTDRPAWICWAPFGTWKYRNADLLGDLVLLNSLDDLEQ